MFPCPSKPCQNLRYSSLVLPPSMEALSGSVLPSRFLEPSHGLRSPSPSSVKTQTRRHVCCFRIKENSNFGNVSSCRTRVNRASIRIWAVRAVAREVSDGGSGGDEGTSGNGGLIPKNEFWFGSDASLDGSEQRGDVDNSTTSMPTMGACGQSGSSRAGLFRTPISGGVQSATSAHDLPRPALAVRNLMEQARFAHLSTVMSRMHHRRAGYPLGSLVDFAPDSMGHPLFSFSPLAIHTRNLLKDPRCTLVVQIPGWSGLSNARVTLFGDVFPLPAENQEWAHKQYIAKHQQGASQQWGNFYYFRMENISDIYFIGGFGTVAWVDVKEYECVQPDKIAVDGGEQYLKELNAMFSKPLKELLSAETEIDDAALISIDSKGTDIRVRQGAQFNVQRLPFESGHAVQTLEEAKAALHKLISKGSRLRLHNKS